MIGAGFTVCKDKRGLPSAANNLPTFHAGLPEAVPEPSSRLCRKRTEKLFLNVCNVLKSRQLTMRIECRKYFDFFA